MAETSSFPEQWLVALASGLRKGVDDRLHWGTETKNFGEGIYGVTKGVGLPTPGIMGRLLATASLHFALLKYSLVPYPDAFIFQTFHQRGNHLAHCELFSPPGTAQQQLPSLPLLSSPTCS